MLKIANRYYFCRLIFYSNFDSITQYIKKGKQIITSLFIIITKGLLSRNATDIM